MAASAPRQPGLAAQAEHLGSGFFEAGHSASAGIPPGRAIAAALRHRAWQKFARPFFVWIHWEPCWLFIAPTTPSGEISMVADSAAVSAMEWE